MWEYNIKLIDHSYVMLTVECGKRDLHESQFVVVLLLFLDPVLDVKVLDVVLTEGDVDLFAESSSGCFAEVMGQLWFLDERTFVFENDFVFFEHRKSVLVILSWPWNLTLHYQRDTLVSE